MSSNFLVQMSLSMVWGLLGCQTLRPVSSPRVIEGEETKEFDGVGILAKNGKDMCTASLLSSHKIVTAAHCVQPKRLKDEFSFHVGPAFKGSTRYLIKECIPHPRYDEANSHFDIAYCVTVEPVKATVIGIMTQLDQDALGKSLLIVGYGRNQKPEFGGDGGSGIKRKGVIKVVDLLETKLKGESPGVSSCNGDSGGPAFIQDSDGSWKLAGVVSCGNFECSSYGVYTRVDRFLGFLGQAGTPDFAGVLATCPASSAEGICEGSTLVKCHTDCFQTNRKQQNCALLEKGSCYEYKQRKAATCVDKNWHNVTLRFGELVMQNGLLQRAGVLDGDIFLDTKNVHSGMDPHNQIIDGQVTEMLPKGWHYLQIRRWHSSSSVGISKPLAFYVDEKSTQMEILSGKIPVQIKVKGFLTDGESFYISGQGNPLGDWKKAFKLVKQGDDYVFSDMLPLHIEYKVIKAKSDAETIEIGEGVLWQKGSNRKISATDTHQGVIDLVKPEF